MIDAEHLVAAVRTVLFRHMKLQQPPRAIRVPLNLAVQTRPKKSKQKSATRAAEKGFIAINLIHRPNSRAARGKIYVLKTMIRIGATYS